MEYQISVVEQRDGRQAALEYAQRALSAYRAATKYRSGRRRHFAHDPVYRASFVKSILSLRSYIRQRY